MPDEKTDIKQTALDFGDLNNRVTEAGFEEAKLAIRQGGTLYEVSSISLEQDLAGKKIIVLSDRLITFSTGYL